MKTTKIKTKGMHCGSCEKLVKMELEELEGVNKVDVSFKTGVVEVEFDENKVKEKDIIEVIELEGYEIK